MAAGKILTWIIIVVITTVAIKSGFIPPIIHIPVLQLFYYMWVRWVAVEITFLVLLLPAVMFDTFSCARFGFHASMFSAKSSCMLM